MGIVNVTPDSFSDGGEYIDTETALRHCQRLVSEGASILDIGGESSGPGSTHVTETEEWNRISAVLEGIQKMPIRVSVDTWKASIAHTSLEKGVNIINDVTALRGDEEMVNVLQKSNCQVVLMYSKDKSARTTSEDVSYTDVIQHIGDFLQERIEYAVSHKINRERLILDPGMGAFLSGNPEESFTLLRRFSELKSRFPDLPLLVGTSRKSFLSSGIPSGISSPKERCIPSTITALHAQKSGADILRVHDVAPHVAALHTQEALLYPLETNVFLGLGTNMGNREAYLQQAREHIEKIAHITAVSSVRETQPWGKTNQPNFLNQVIQVSARGCPKDFLHTLQSIEQRIGRQQREKWGMREIDIDILFWGDRQQTSDALTLPHPLWRERDFVLIPMREIAPIFLQKWKG